MKEFARDLVEAGRVLYEQGMVPATSGNFSARVAENSIAITVSGRHKGQLNTSDIMLIDYNGESGDDRQPSAETGLHLQIYQHYPDAAVILHHHSLYATLLSQLVAGEVVLADYELLKAFTGIGTHETVLRLPVFENNQDISILAGQVDNYMDANSPLYGYLIRGHGLYTWAGSVATALKYVEAFEFLFKCELMKRGVTPL